MPDVEVELSDRLLNELDRAADDDFLNREEAVEEFLRLGIKAYEVEEDDDEPGMGEEMWGTDESSMGGGGTGMGEEDTSRGDERTF